MAAADDRRMSTRATGVVGIAILSSRLLGLIREMVFAGLFGAGRNLDAFLMAFRLPNLLRDLFAEGALSTAFITTFSKKIAIEGDQSAWRLANKVATLTAVFMSAITLLGIMFAPQLVELLTWGSWSPDKTVLTILLTRIMWPFMLLVSLAALVMGMLNAKHVFGPPAMASSYFNLGSIIAGVAIGYWLDPHFGARSLVGLAIGTLIGGAWQLIGQFPSLWHVGYKYHADFHWRDEGVRTVLTLMGPAVIAASAVQVNVLINSGFLAIGANLFLNWLFTFRLGWGHRGLAFSTSLVATINFLLLYALMRRHTHRLETRQTLIGLGKICLAGAPLALICWAANYWWLDAWASLHFFAKLATLLVTIVFVVLVVLWAAFFLRVSEVQDIIDVFQRRKIRRMV